MTQALLEVFGRDSVSKPDRADEQNRTYWNLIINIGCVMHAWDCVRAIERFMTTKLRIVAKLEGMRDSGILVLKRALLDARLGQIKTALVWSDNESACGRMYASDTCRVSCSGKECPKQVLNADFRDLTGENRMRNGNPGDFTLSFGATRFVIWMCEWSHNMCMMRDILKEL